MTLRSEEAERWSIAAPAALRRLVEDLELWCDQTLEGQNEQTFASGTSVTGQEAIHVALRYELVGGSLTGQGAWLLPWREAARLSGWFERADEKRRAELLEAAAPDATAKLTLLEISGVVASAVEAALGRVGLAGMACMPAGCQGVAPGRRANLDLEAGTMLWVCRETAEWAAGQPFQSLLMVPELIPPEPEPEFDPGSGKPRVEKDSGS